MELGVGLLLMAGLFARCAALALFFYTLVLALIFHAYWAAPVAQARLQASIFFEHLSMMGGMLMVVVFGAGALVWTQCCGGGLSIVNGLMHDDRGVPKSLRSTRPNKIAALPGSSRTQPCDTGRPSPEIS